MQERINTSGSSDSIASSVAVPCGSNKEVPYQQAIVGSGQGAEELVRKMREQGQNVILIDPADIKDGRISDGVAAARARASAEELEKQLAKLHSVRSGVKRRKSKKPGPRGSSYFNKKNHGKNN